LPFSAVGTCRFSSRHFTDVCKSRVSQDILNCAKVLLEVPNIRDRRLVLTNMELNTAENTDFIINNLMLVAYFFSYMYTHYLVYYCRVPLCTRYII
jgi:hypothetical protein